MNKTVILTTGGSGGHIFPAQAVAEALLKRHIKVIFMTDKRGGAFQGLDVPTYRLTASSVTGRSVLGKIKALFCLLIGGAQAIYYLLHIRPALVVGFGSYASLPTALAAQMMKIPVLLHEQNAVLGRANRIIAKGPVRLIMTTFAKTYAIADRIGVLHTGIPVRPAVKKEIGTPYPETGFNLVIFGGSQGASFFARHVAPALTLLPESLQKKMTVIQQVRPEDMDFVTKLYQTKAHWHDFTLRPFFDDMPRLIANAHLVIGRAGASTIAEALVLGRPALFIPLPSAADNHQKLNAQQITPTGGYLLEEKDFNPKKFAAFVADIVANKAERLDKVKGTQTLAISDADEQIADVIMDVLRGIRKK